MDQADTSLWHHPAFRKLWVGQTVSVVGSHVTLLALPLAAALTLDATPIEMGLLIAAGSAPDVVVALFAGVWVDRLRRRPILIGADLGRAALLASVPAAAGLGLLGMPQLYVVAFLAGALAVLFHVAHGSFLPALVPRRQLVEANGKLELSRSVARIAGPGLAGGLVQVLTAPFAILADACSFLVSALFLGMIRTPEPEPEPATARRGVRPEIGEGLRFTFGQPLLWAITAGTATFAFFGNVVAALYALYVTRDLGVSPGTLGLVYAVGASGALLGAATAGRLTRRLGLGPATVAALLLAGLGVLLIPLAASAPAPAVLLIGQELCLGFGAAVFGINTVSIGQAVTPDRLLGRARASSRFVWGGSLAFGALTGGALGEAIGLRPALWIAAGGTLLALPWLLASPFRALREPPHPPPSPGPRPVPRSSPPTP